MNRALWYVNMVSRAKCLVLATVLGCAFCRPAGADATSYVETIDGITYVFLEGGRRVYDVNIGKVEYGLSETRLLRFVPSDFGVDQIKRIELSGCASCTNTKIIDANSFAEDGFYQCKIAFNRRPDREQELGKYKDVFAVLAKDRMTLARLKILHFTRLSEKVSPNQVVIEEAVPEQSYRTVLHKRTVFAANSVQVDNPNILVTNWHDGKESLEIELVVRHTYKSGRLDANLLIAPQKGKRITVPVTADVREFIEVDPQLIVLGVLEPGQTSKRYVTIRSTKKCIVLNCESQLKYFGSKVIYKTEFHAQIDMSFAVDETMKSGPFRANVAISTQLSKHPINVPVYGVVVLKAGAR